MPTRYCLLEEPFQITPEEGALPEKSDDASGGTTCLTLLVEHMFSSKVVSHAANSVGRIRQVTP